MRAPVLRTSSISSWWRSRSRMTTVRSRTLSRLALATQRRFWVGEAVMSMAADGVRADGDLLHVDAGPGVEHRAALADGDDRERVAPAEGRERGAVDGVDGDVAQRAGAVADLLAVEQHRRFVLLALADDDDAVHRRPWRAPCAWPRRRRRRRRSCRPAPSSGTRRGRPTRWCAPAPGPGCDRGAGWTSPHRSRRRPPRARRGPAGSAPSTGRRWRSGSVGRAAQGPARVGSPAVTPASPLDLTVLAAHRRPAAASSRGLAVTIGDQLVQDVGMVEHGCSSVVWWDGGDGPRRGPSRGGWRRAVVVGATSPVRLGRRCSRCGSGRSEIPTRCGRPAPREASNRCTGPRGSPSCQDGHRPVRSWWLNIVTSSPGPVGRLHPGAALPTDQSRG